MSLEDKMIVGYQFGDGNLYRGEYQFPNNLDQEHIYLPPNTTLIAPPLFDKEVHDAVWDPIKQSWFLVERPKPEPLVIEELPILEELPVEIIEETKKPTKVKK